MKTDSAAAGRAPLDVTLLPGDHLCCFYGSGPEHSLSASSYIRQGLENGEKVIYIADVMTAKDMLRMLKREGLSAYSHMAAGSLQVLASKNSYMEGGAFEPEAMFGFFEKEAALAMEEGYGALRVAGETGWVVSGEIERLLEYEAAVNDFVKGKTWLALCMYDRRKFPEEILKRVLISHPAVLAGDRVLKNAYFSGGDDNPEASAGRDFNCMLDNLLRENAPLR